MTEVHSSQMVLITLGLPRHDQERRLINRAAKLGPNHRFPGGTRDAPLVPTNFHSAFWRVVNRSTIIGKGKGDYKRAKTLLKRWAHFQLRWAFVPLDTPIQPLHIYCNFAKVFVPWIANPLRIEYIEENEKTKQGGKRFAYGTTTLHGHLLAGEERFSLDWSPSTNHVTYEIYSFSRPGHILSVLGYPMVHALQSAFVRESLQSMQDYLRH